jgi:hypothetical protein
MVGLAKHQYTAEIAFSINGTSYGGVLVTLMMLENS